MAPSGDLHYVTDGTTTREYESSRRLLQYTWMIVEFALYFNMHTFSHIIISHMAKSSPRQERNIKDDYQLAGDYSKENISLYLPCSLLVVAQDINIWSPTHAGAEEGPKPSNKRKIAEITSKSPS